MRRHFLATIIIVEAIVVGLTVGYAITLVSQRIPASVTVIVRGGGPIHAYWQNGSMITSISFGFLRQAESENISLLIRNDNGTFDSSIGWESNVAVVSNGTITDSLTFQNCAASCVAQDAEGYTLPPAQQIIVTYSVNVSGSAPIQDYSWTLTLGRP